MHVQVIPDIRDGVGIDPAGQPLGRFQVGSGPIKGRLPLTHGPKVGRRVGTEDAPKLGIQYGIEFQLGGCDGLTKLGSRIACLPCPLAGVPTEKPLDEERLDGKGRDRSRSRAAAAGSVMSLAAVIGSRLSMPGLSHRVPEGVPAGGAPKDAGQESGRTAGRISDGGLPLIGSGESLAVDQRLVSGEVDDALPTMNLAEVCPVADEVADGLDRPHSPGLGLEVVGDLLPGVAVNPSPEYLADEIGLGPGLESAVDLLVSERDIPADEDTALDGVLSGDEPRLGLPVDLELGNGREDRGDHPASVAARVQAFGNGEERRVVVIEDRQELSEVRHRPAEAVEFGDDDAGRLAGDDPLHRGIESGPMTGLARLVEILKDLTDGPAVQLCPAFNRSPLFDRRDERLALTARDTRDTDVSVNNLHRLQRYRNKVAGSLGRAYLSTTQRDRNPRSWLLAGIAALVILAAPSPAEAKIDCGTQTRTAEQHWSWAEKLRNGYSIPAWAKSKHRFSVVCAAGPNHRRVMQTRWKRIKRSILPANHDLWIAIGRCEQPGSGYMGINWSHTGPTYQGGLGFWYGTWTGFKYPRMPSNAGYATWRQQMKVANRLLALYGTSPWGCA